MFMECMNSVVVDGNVVREPTVRETSNGTLVANFSLATNRSFRSGASYEKETSFFDVESWDKLAAHVRDSCEKGTGLRVIGHLKQNRWDGQDGKHYSRVVISAEEIVAKPVFLQGEKAIEMHKAAIERASGVETREIEMVAEGENAATGELVF